MQTYSNADFYLSAYLLTKNYKLIEHTRTKGMTTFVFESTSDIHDAVTEYYTMNATVEPMKYGNSIRTLKSIIHSYSTSPSNRGNKNGYQSHTEGRR
jgi:uncharacterized protein (UPF0332 family)